MIGTWTSKQDELELELEIKKTRRALRRKLNVIL